MRDTGRKPPVQHFASLGMVLTLVVVVVVVELNIDTVSVFLP